MLDCETRSYGTVADAEVVPVTLSGIGKKPIACALESDRVNVPANHGAQQAVGQRRSALSRDCSPIARHIAQPIDIHKEAHNVAQRMRVLSFDSLRSALPCASYFSKRPRAGTFCPRPSTTCDETSRLPFSFSSPCLPGCATPCLAVPRRAEPRRAVPALNEPPVTRLDLICRFGSGPSVRPMIRSVRSLALLHGRGFSSWPAYLPSGAGRSPPGSMRARCSRVVKASRLGVCAAMGGFYERRFPDVNRCRNYGRKKARSGRAGEGRRARRPYATASATPDCE